MTMLYYKTHDVCAPSLLTEITEGLEAAIERDSARFWFRVDNEPVRLIHFEIGLNSHIANALVRHISGEFYKVSIARLEVIDPNDDARNATLVCPQCGGYGEVQRLNNPTGERCLACFGTGLFLRSLH